MTTLSTKADDIARVLEDEIVGGVIPPDTVLRQETLSERFEVSRTPVREALLRLGQVGLVQARPGRSTTVAPLDPVAVRDAGAVVAAMHRLAVAQAVARLTEDHLTAMREANQRFASALAAGDADAALAADDEFHAVPVQVAGNQAVATVLEQYSPVLRRLERLRFSSSSASTSVARHTTLVDLCAAGDAEHAADLAQQIWDSLEPLIATLTTETDTPSLEEEAL